MNVKQGTIANSRVIIRIVKTKAESCTCFTNPMCSSLPNDWKPALDDHREDMDMDQLEIARRKTMSVDFGGAF